MLRFFRVSPNRTVIVAGSTMRGEEAAVLRAFARIKTTTPGALLILAPRHPERFGEVERLARDAGFVTARRSELPIDAEPRADVVVLDTIGELAQLYQLATAVFVGGSLADHGGHNILEPAMFGKPIVFGPHMQNFKEIADAFLANGAAMQVQSERELDEALLDAGHRSGAPRAARRRGARAGRSQPRRQGQDARGDRRAAAAGATARRRRSGPSDWCIDLSTLERRLRRGGRVAARVVRARSVAPAPALTRPVISVGNLRVGGSGKTPIVAYIARLLLGAAASGPAILTRGYGRRVARDGVTVVSDGTRVLADLDTAGDEPLMLARALPGVPVLVGADRYLVAAVSPSATRRHRPPARRWVSAFRAGARRRSAAGRRRAISPIGRCRPDGCASRSTRPRAARCARWSPPATTPAAERIGARARRRAGVSRHARDRRAALARRARLGRRAAEHRACSSSPASRGRSASSPTSRRPAGQIVGDAWRSAIITAFTRATSTRIAAAARAAGAAIVLTTEKDAVRLDGLRSRRAADRRRCR